MNSKKFIGNVTGPVKPYTIEDTKNLYQPIVSYQATTGSVNPPLPNQIQLIVPALSNKITVNHSTSLLKTKHIYVDGNITNATRITANQFVGSLSGNATTVTNGVYLDETSTQTINGNVSVKQLDVDGTRCVYQQGTGGEDTRGTFRVLQNTSIVNQDGMLINYGSTGGANANIRFYANSTTERMRILADTGNVRTCNTAPSEKLEVNGNMTAGNNSYFLSS